MVMKVIRNTFLGNSACQCRIVHDKRCEALYTEAQTCAEADPVPVKANSDLPVGNPAVYVSAEMRCFQKKSLD